MDNEKLKKRKKQMERPVPELNMMPTPDPPCPAMMSPICRTASQSVAVIFGRAFTVAKAGCGGLWKW